MFDERQLEELVEKSGHYVDFSDFHTIPDSPTIEQKEYFERVKNLTKEFNTQLETEVDGAVIQTSNYLRNKKIESGTKETWKLSIQLREYIDRKSKEIVDIVMTTVFNQYGIKMSRYLNYVPVIITRVINDLQSRLYHKMLSETDVADELFGGGLPEEERRQYLEAAEIAGIINPETFEAFQLAAGELGRTRHFFGMEKAPENFVIFHTHPADSWPSSEDLAYGAPQIVISKYNTLFVREKGPTPHEKFIDIIDNKDIYFPLTKPRQDKLSNFLYRYNVEILPQTRSDIKFMEATTDILGETPLTEIDEKSEIIKEWRERQSATQLPGVQVGGIHKPFVDIQLHNWEPPERRNFDIEAHLKRMLKEDDIRVPQFGRAQEILPTRKEEEKKYPSPIQDGLDVVAPRSDNLEYGSDFGGRRFRMEEKEESRLALDLTLQEYDDLLAYLKQLEPEEVLLVLDELKRRKKIRPPQIADATAPAYDKLESDQEMYRRILEELEKE